MCNLQYYHYKCGHIKLAAEVRCSDYRVALCCDTASNSDRPIVSHLDCAACHYSLNANATLFVPARENYNTSSEKSFIVDIPRLVAIHATTTDRTYAPSYCRNNAVCMPATNRPALQTAGLRSDLSEEEVAAFHSGHGPIIQSAAAELESQAERYAYVLRGGDDSKQTEGVLQHTEPETGRKEEEIGERTEPP